MARRPNKDQPAIPAIVAPPPTADNPFTRPAAGLAGVAFIALMIAACLGSLWWTTGRVAPAGGDAGPGSPRYDAGDPKHGRLPPWWWPASDEVALRLNGLVPPETLADIARRHGMTEEEAAARVDGPAAADLRAAWPRYALGTDVLGRSLLIRCLTGGGISLLIGIAAALVSVVIGTAYGAIAAYAGGRTDAVMMRIVDVLYGLPYVLLVVLLAIASDAVLDEYVSRSRARERLRDAIAVLVAEGRGLEDAAALADADPAARPAVDSLAAALVRDEPGESPGVRRDRLSVQRDSFVAGVVELAAAGSATDGRLAPAEVLARATGLAARQGALLPRRVGETEQTVYDVLVLLVAIGGVSWLTMARVIRGQVLSLKARPFIEAARAMGVPVHRQLIRHLLPNLIGPIVVYATLLVPQAILQESFLSFLGIGVKPPLPSWGGLAAEGLNELNPVRSYWWLLLFPCLLLASTLLALNFVGEGLREAFDPRRARR